MKNHHKLAGFVFIITLLISLSPALAQVEFTNDQGQFLAQNPNLRFQDFSATKVQPTDGEQCNVPVNSESDDDCFSPGDILPELAFYNLPVNPVGGLRVLGTAAAGPGAPPGPILIESSGEDSFDVTVNPGATRIGLTVGCYTQGDCNGSADVTVLDTHENLIGQTTVSLNEKFNNFLGITSDVPICCVLLDHQDGENQEHGNGVLNVWFGGNDEIVPTLSEWGMIAAAAGLGLVGVFFAVKRKRAQVV